MQSENIYVVENIALICDNYFKLRDSLFKFLFKLDIMTETIYLCQQCIVSKYCLSF